MQTSITFRCRCIISSYFLLESMKRLVKVRVKVFVVSLSVVFFFSNIWKLSETVRNYIPDCALTILNPPVLTADERSLLNSYSLQAEPSKVLSALSTIVQRQIDRINSPTNCSSTKSLVCGHFEPRCGFGCQFHHRLACLMMSYALSIPLIHESRNAWPYSTQWEEMLLPLGSNCTPTSQSYYWTWNQSPELYARNRMQAKLDNNTSSFKWNTCQDLQMLSDRPSDNVDYPLVNGIVADEELAGYVARYTQNPLMWWTGQFVMHGLQLNSKTQNKIEEDKALIGLTPDCIGLQIRRTDKILEAPDSFHNLSEYFDQVYRITNTSEKISGRNKPQVYLATDDPIVFHKAKQQYTDFEILGFPATLGTPREYTLYYMIRDIYLLHSCKHIICGLTSNICRLLLEMLNYSDHFNSNSRLTSLDGNYSYILIAHDIDPLIYSMPAN